MSKQAAPEAEATTSFVLIRIRVHKGTGQATIVDELGDEQVFDPLPPGKQKDIYQSAAGFKVVGTLYHSHSSPACLYWNGAQPIIIPC
jgi:hypothetical protein